MLEWLYDLNNAIDNLDESQLERLEPKEIPRTYLPDQRTEVYELQSSQKWRTSLP
jgi:hypothetical protein